MQQPLSLKTPSAQKADETIVVVKRSTLFPHGAWHGLQQENINFYCDLITTHQELHPRSLMEVDPTYKQIIPYLIFCHDNRFFLMQRQATASAQQLKNKYSLGIGGHIRQEDVQEKDIFSWAEREFNEEVSYNGTYTVTPLGILNDDSNQVGSVHVGLILLLTASSADISIKSELKSGQLLSLEECKSYEKDMESWSQIVYKQLCMNSSY